MNTSNTSNPSALLNFTDDLKTFSDDLAFICDALGCLLEEFSTLDKNSQSGARQHLEQLKSKADFLAIEINIIQERGASKIP